MASMSHCVIENTAHDMVQVNYKFQIHQEDIEANQYEKAHLDQLYRSCKEFVEEYEEYLQDKEKYIREHSDDAED